MKCKLSQVGADSTLSFRVKYISAQNIIGYLPGHQCFPAELSTVYTLLHQCLEKLRLLQQRFAIVTFDKAIYTRPEKSEFTSEFVWKAIQQRCLCSQDCFRSFGSSLLGAV